MDLRSGIVEMVVIVVLLLLLLLLVAVVRHWWTGALRVFILVVVGKIGAAVVRIVVPVRLPSADVRLLVVVGATASSTRAPPGRTRGGGGGGGISITAAAAASGRVLLPVAQHAVLEGEAPVADVALERALAGVRPHMPSQVFRRPEATHTECADNLPRCAM